MEFVFDTGAQVSVVTDRLARKLGLRMSEPEVSLVGADDSKLKVVGMSKVVIGSSSRDIDAKVYVLADARRNLLGMPELSKLNLIAVVDALSKSSFDPVQEYPGLFTGLGTLPGIFKIRLRQDAEPRCLYAPRSIPAGLRDKAKLEIDSMLAKDVIEPVEEPTEWCSGLTIAPKPNGKIRMCVDLTQLNKSVEREIYPLPRVSDMLSRLAEGRIFSKLDANSGF